MLLYGQGDLRSVTAVAGDIVVDGTAGDLGPHTLPSVTTVAGDLVFAHSGASGTNHASPAKRLQNTEHGRTRVGVVHSKVNSRPHACIGVTTSGAARRADMELTFTSIAGSLVVNANTFNYRFPELADVGNALELHVSGTTGTVFASLALVNSLILDMPVVPFRSIFPGRGHRAAGSVGRYTGHDRALSLGF